jgi:aldehyde:ferredoxin oxidoreductase
MIPLTVTLPRFRAMHGWVGRILRVDLSDMRIWAQETALYLPDYLGARGIAARICWDEYPDPVAEFDPANPLMVFPGALTGTRSGYSGRTSICTFSPQAYPHNWFTRSNMGGHFGGELKRAGYDGIVVTGACDEPVRIRIRDDEVSVLPAGDFWGLDAIDSLEALEAADGKGTRSITIGPTGERLSRIAVILCGSSSAAGQGGFGAVMGSKKLKGISVRGTGRVPLAHPETITSLNKAIAAEAKPPAFLTRTLDKLNEELADLGGGVARRVACTESCLTPCAAYVEGVPGTTVDRAWEGLWHCTSANRFRGGQNRRDPVSKIYQDWGLDLRAAFEMNALTNRYGLNQFELICGMVPWLIACQKQGRLSALDDLPMDWNSPKFWAEFVRVVAYREGVGDALAEGGWRASSLLGLDPEIVSRSYAGWGQATHYTGHGGLQLPFPYWLITALQWVADTRDPIAGGHCSLSLAGASYHAHHKEGEEGVKALQDLHRICERRYGDPKTYDPDSGYAGKAGAGHYHTLRAVIKDCLPTDDLAGFPLTWSNNSPDHLCRFHDIEGIGDIEGPSAEYHLFIAGTGTDWSEAEFDAAAERVYTLERALQVRHWGRDRSTDEMILPHFERDEMFANPVLGVKQGLDREQFAPVMDEFYTQHGWNPATARPTRETMAELGMGELYEPMVEGARRRSNGRVRE